LVKVNLFFIGGKEKEKKKLYRSYWSEEASVGPATSARARKEVESLTMGITMRTDRESL
jgi:hypothetical protein